MLPPFKNEPLTNFNDPAQRAAFEDALKLVKSRFGEKIPLVIGGERIYTDDTIKDTCPANPDVVMAYVSKGAKEHALLAIRTADRVFQTWKYYDPDARARILLRAAALMRRRKHEFSATMVYEIGKNWMEADADTAEAIDFLEFYAREMMRLHERQPVVDYPGEENNLYYIPLGVGAVIPPWNFPNAIMTGMTSASMVTGNTVILKPASITPVIAYRFFEILEEAGMPAGVVNYLPGPGGAIGDTIVDHRLTRFIAFTGSMEIGQRIFQRAAKVQRGQLWLKRTILEMGGKDAILVDDDADLDFASEQIVISAFGFQGQKCSACSRLIIHEKVYDTLLEKVVERVKKIKTGDTENFENWHGPVSDGGAYEKILEYIEIGKKEGRLVAGGNKAGFPGWFIEPTVIADVAPTARIMQEEIFGPVLAVCKVKNFDEGLKVFNNTIFGLTGAYFGKRRDRIERVRREAYCGNLYINRKCTGALVGVQPFGGFNMSGTDSKAGGRDYLQLFLQAKSVTERF
ncbi:MAG: L-glutamate gamma-semialdehyde dehydrogenase [bacterium]|nr:L-glutamate gamma-semialdehyde dehydrogenase [bacterium]